MAYSDLLKDPRWQKKRLQIMDRDEFKCVLCKNEKDTLNVHHITYSGKPWEAPDDFLVTLCEKCHENEEDYKRTNKSLRTISEKTGVLVSALVDNSLAFSMMKHFNPDELKSIQGKLDAFMDKNMDEIVKFFKNG